MRAASHLVAMLAVACSSGSVTLGDDVGGGDSGMLPPRGDSGDTTPDAGSVKDAGATADAAPPAPDSGPAPTSIHQHCVDRINAYRKTLNLPPYTRVAPKEPCADGEAKSDALANKPHGAFPACGELAQNECPGWPTANMPASLDKCLAAMWAEGPGVDFSKHGHYINMSSTKYTKVFCGFYDLGNGKFWSVQDFQ